MSDYVTINLADEAELQRFRNALLNHGYQFRGGVYPDVRGALREFRAGEQENALRADLAAVSDALANASARNQWIGDAS